MFRSLVWLGVCVSLAMLLGCRSDAPDIVEIEGTLTYKGKPIPNIKIFFCPTTGRPSWAVTDQNGHFVLDYDEQFDGAKVDTHTVYFVDEGGMVDPTAALSGAAPPKRSPDAAELVRKYNSRETSTLKVEVKERNKNFKLDVN
ncbi:MAG TPA: hypothetical protein VFB80_11930 [Pirellulaceae bacterium]|nr:hypothetical protein [Pirellulaceae bacterium]